MPHDIPPAPNSPLLEEFLKSCPPVPEDKYPGIKPEPPSAEQQALDEERKILMTKLAEEKEAALAARHPETPQDKPLSFDDLLNLARKQRGERSDNAIGGKGVQLFPPTGPAYDIKGVPIDGDTLPQA